MPKKSKPKVLCLDLGTTTGFALGDVNSLGFVSGTLKLGTKTGKAFSDFSVWLKELNLPEGSTVVVEKPHAGVYFHATHKLFGLLAIVEWFCEVNGLPEPIMVSPATIKKFWTGDGRAKKPAMLSSTRERGYTVKDHNESDAVAIFCWYGAK